jgi:hypothetical protein
MQLRRITRYLAWVFLLLIMAARPAMVSAVEALPRQVGAQPKSGSRAGLVIQFDDGRAETRCVTFEGDEIRGADLLAQADLEAIVDVSSGMGVTVCQIAGEGCAYPAEPCFCQCMGGGECSYWNYFYLEPGEREWTYSALGAAMRQVTPGSVEAWVWGDGSTPPAVQVSFEEICVSEAPPTSQPTEIPTGAPAITPSASPVPPTPLPDATAPPSSPTQAPTAPPTATTSLPMATDLPPAPGPTPTADSGQDLSSYLPFGLALVGLALIGAVVWLRRR